MHDDGDSVHSQERRSTILLVVEKTEDLLKVQFIRVAGLHLLPEDADDELRHRLVELQDEISVEAVADQYIAPPADDLPAPRCSR